MSNDKRALRPDDRVCTFRNRIVVANPNHPPEIIDGDVSVKLEITPEELWRKFDDVPAPDFALAPKWFLDEIK